MIYGVVKTTLTPEDVAFFEKTHCIEKAGFVKRKLSGQPRMLTSQELFELDEMFRIRLKKVKDFTRKQINRPVIPGNRQYVVRINAKGTYVYYYTTTFHEEATIMKERMNRVWDEEKIKQDGKKGER